MRNIAKRFLALPVAAAGAVALVVVGSGAAHASSFESGTVTVTINDSYLLQLAHHGILVLPQGYTSLTHNSTTHTETIVFTATTGDASLNNGVGTLSLSGDILVKHWCHSVKLGSLNFNLTNASLDGATATSGDQPLVDLGGNVDGTVTPNADGSNTQFLEASGLTLDATGAAFLDSALQSSQFVAGATIGSFSATWTD